MPLGRESPSLEDPPQGAECSDFAGSLHRSNRERRESGAMTAGYAICTLRPGQSPCIFGVRNPSSRSTFIPCNQKLLREH
jgi:hypothetical protein